MKVSVILVNYNGKSFLEKCILSLTTQTFKPLEVIVLDSASNDGSAEVLKAKTGIMKIVLLPENKGFGAAANEGIRRMQGDTALIMNSDTALKTDFLEKLVNSAEKQDASYGMFSGKLLRMEDETLVDSAGQFIRRSLRPIERNYGTKDSNFSAGRIFSACGAVMLVKKELLEAVETDGQYFDEDLFMYFEDFDLGWRAARAGFKCYYEPSAIATHYRGGSGKHNGSKYFLFRKKETKLKRHLLANRYLVLTKNASFGLIFRNLPFILAYELFFWLYLLLFDIRVISGLKKYFSLRRKFKAKYKSSDSESGINKWII